MKLNPNNKPIQMYNPRQEMKYLKEALKKDYLYSTDEIRTLKRRLTESVSYTHLTLPTT